MFYSFVQTSRDKPMKFFQLFCFLCSEHETAVSVVFYVACTITIFFACTPRLLKNGSTPVA